MPTRVEIDEIGWRRVPGQGARASWWLRLAALLLAGAAAAPVQAAPPAGTRAGWAQAARRDATRMYDAYRRNDLATVLKYTYSGLLKVMGGEEQMLVVLQQGAATMKDQGYRFRTAKVGAPVQLVAAGDELHVILPLNQVLVAPGGELHVDGYLLGVSADKGKRWTFVDAARLDAAKAREIVPAFNPALKIPTVPEPRLVKK